MVGFWGITYERDLKKIYGELSKPYPFIEFPQNSIIETLSNKITPPMNTDKENMK